MEKVTFHRFDPEIYPFLLYVGITKDIKDLQSSFDCLDDGGMLRYEDLIGKSHGVTWILKDKKGFKSLVVTFKDKNSMTYQNVAHESAHGAKFVFKQIDAEIEPHEPFEYLVGWIASKCEIVKKMKK